MMVIFSLNRQDVALPGNRRAGRGSREVELFNLAFEGNKRLVAEARSRGRGAKMATIHRALFTWFMLLMFVILLVLRLDERVKWNWFLIFLPMWIFDGILIVYITFYMGSHCKNGFDTNDQTMGRKVAFLAGMFLKLSFQVLLCLRLQYYTAELNLYYVMIPAWILLIVLIVDVSLRLR